MNQLHLEIDNNRDAFNPGESVSLQLSWELEKPVGQIKLRLIWFTNSEGDADFKMLQEEIINSPGLNGSGRLQFELPDMPYSYKGKLFFLVWAFEVELFPLKEFYRQEIILGPNQETVILEIT